MYTRHPIVIHVYQSVISYLFERLEVYETNHKKPLYEVIIYMWLEVTLLKLIPSELRQYGTPPYWDVDYWQYLYNNTQHDHKHIFFS